MRKCKDKVTGVCICGLRKSHFEQLLSYLEDANREGSYYGNREEFKKRHAELTAWVQGVVELVDRAYIPKKKPTTTLADGLKGRT